MKKAHKITAEQEFYDLQDVAKLLNLCRMTVYRYVVRKRLPAYRFGRHYRIRKSDLELFISHYRV